MDSHGLCCCVTGRHLGRKCEVRGSKEENIRGTVVPGLQNKSRNVIKRTGLLQITQGRTTSTIKFQRNTLNLKVLMLIYVCLYIYTPDQLSLHQQASSTGGGLTTSHHRTMCGTADPVCGAEHLDLEEKRVQMNLQPLS